MNYLAHAFLSGKNKNILIGNFLADAAKGHTAHYDEEIRKGIKLHRIIDHFTDGHPVVTLSKQRLHPKYHKYAGVIVDMYYDHFLAKSWPVYSNRPLEEFAATTYELLIKNFAILPPRLKRMLPYMIAFNWLVAYSDTSNLRRFFTGLSKRTAFYSGMEHCVDDLEEHYPLFKNEFECFFPELIKKVEKSIELL
ncbi:MAG: acyl carrier protein phosphodiesterase [Bacteroidota bacterium]